LLVRIEVNVSPLFLFPKSSSFLCWCFSHSPLLLFVFLSSFLGWSRFG
jgi:hypothetical protein